MKKMLLLFCLSLFLPLISSAQASIGFADPDNIRPLVDYRLPSWGYSNLFWDFSMNGLFTATGAGSQQNSAVHNLFSGRLSPAYLRHQESEPRISSYSIRSDINFSFIDRSTFNNDEEYNSEVQFELSWGVHEKFYINGSDLFFTGEFSGDFQQLRLREKEAPQSAAILNETSLQRTLRPSIAVGAGYGRIRGVNPVIRALRLNERFNTLNTGQSMNYEDITGAAGLFARHNGYLQTYDRPQKHFWGDMDNILSVDLSALDAFDLLYLTETTSEALGDRKEGWQIMADTRLQYQIRYTLQEDEISDESESRLTRATYFIPTVSGIWRKNLSLKHQIGLDGSFLYFKRINDASVPGLRILSASANWLYSVTDRILTNTSAGYRRLNRGDGATDNLSLNSAIHYFIENRVSLFADLTISYIFDSQSASINVIDRRTIVFNAGFRYYMKRELF